MIRCLLLLSILLLPPWAADAQYLFVGLEGTSQATCSSDLVGFPEVTYRNHYTFDVSGAAATEEGTLYLCNGAYTTHLYRATQTQYPEELCTISVDITALAYGNGVLWGYSNYATPKGIYEIDPVTGNATLVLDVYTEPHFRFFGLDFNPADGLLYGYTEYGDSGLYSINLTTGEMIKLADTIPASNGQGRALAVGNNTVYLAATRGDDDIPFFAYDISQGIGGEWVGFTNAYPTEHATGGAAWIPDPAAAIEGESGAIPPAHLRLLEVCPNPTTGPPTAFYETSVAGPVRVSLHGVDGRCIARRPVQMVDAGVHRIDLASLSASRSHLASTMIFLRVETQGEVAGQRIQLIR